MTNNQNDQQSDRSIDELFKDMQNNSWAGGNILRAEIPRVVSVSIEALAAMTAKVELRGTLFVVPGGVGVADVLYLCRKTAADGYEFLVLS